jgi:ferrochelatase
VNARPVLLVNLGSPASTDPADVRRYLDQFLMDPYVIDVPTPLRALIVKGAILPTRPPKTAAAYAKIWTAEGSPLIAISRRLRAALEERLGAPVGLAMRYGEPSIARGIDELLARTGPVDELLVAALYPQRAHASTTTAEVAAREALGARGIRTRFVPPFFDDSGYLDALAARVRADLPTDAQYVLFSYHGLPERQARATGYREQVLTTTDALAARLGLEPGGFGSAFQSRLGPGWLRPFSDVELAALPRRGVTRLAVACPSFVADCLETLEEMALRGRDTFLAAGGQAFTYLRCLNDDPAWIAALAALVA